MPMWTAECRDTLKSSARCRREDGRVKSGQEWNASSRQGTHYPPTIYGDRLQPAGRVRAGSSIITSTSDRYILERAIELPGMAASWRGAWRSRERGVVVDGGGDPVQPVRHATSLVDQYVQYGFNYCSNNSTTASGTTLSNTTYTASSTSASYPAAGDGGGGGPAAAAAAGSK